MNEQKTAQGENTSGRFHGRLIPALTLSLALSFLLTLFGPLELFFTNSSEFDFDLYALLLPLGGMFLVALAAGLIAFGLCQLIYHRLYDLMLLLGAVGLICTYVQGLFLAGNLPPLDGTSIDWNSYHGEYLKSCVLWAVVLLAFVLLTRLLHMAKMRKLVTGLSLFILAMLMVTLVTVGIQNHGFQRKTQPAVTKTDEFQMSTDQNLVVFVLDAVDSGTLRSLMESSDPDFADTLEDFTYYPNTVGAYTFTELSIPYILTGQWYENEQDFSDYYASAMVASPLLTKLKDQNYRVGVYEEDLICDSVQQGDIDNLEETSLRFTSFTQLAKLELKLVWFKYAPYPIKRMATVNMDNFRKILEPTNGSQLFRYVNTDFYQDAGTQKITTTQDKCFRFIHIEGAHVPLRYDKNVNVIGSSNGSYPQNVECAMTVLNRYLTDLKEAGVYDNTAIVVMADHGYGIYWNNGFLGRSNPLLAVKGVGEKHAMAISEAPISYEDLQEAFSRLLDGKASTQVFDAKEGEKRSRRFLLYNYLHEDHIEEYYQNGYATDQSGFTATGEVYDRNKNAGTKNGHSKHKN